jgi:hypothetical protein
MDGRQASSMKNPSIRHVVEVAGYGWNMRMTNVQGVYNAGIFFAGSAKCFGRN